ncbi:ATP-dependent dethiobiotin synthetase BioD [Salmonella enterica subsp. enterica serovar Choleraesuis]|nr:ATP-dependent dethiobiotin synthetase BioD [Salmonella enterica subsp. enterica serovar Choleraesuis]
MAERWFITGTDTEVGKTVASCALLQAASRAGYRTAGYKPVASGSEMTPEGLRNEDALALQRNSSVDLPYDRVNPYTFAEPTSPHIVSAITGEQIKPQVMTEGLQALQRQADWVQVEGAGGWFTPLGDGFSFSDWAVEQQFKVILVVGVKLGCINHALLTAQAVAQAGLRLAGWIANDIQPQGRYHQEYMATLRELIPAPLLGEIPHLTELTPQTELGTWLSLDPLNLPPIMA